VRLRLGFWGSLEEQKEVDDCTKHLKLVGTAREARHR